MKMIAYVEDEDAYAQHFLTVMDRYQEETKNYMNIQRFRDGESFLTGYKQIYDVVFLDIVLGERKMDGMTVARKLREMDAEVTLIFLTTLTRCALEGYSVGAVDYLVQPIDYYRLKMRMDYFFRRSQDDSVNVTIVKLDKFRLLVSDKIYYIEVTDHTLYCHTIDGVIKSHGSLSALEKNSRS